MRRTATRTLALIAPVALVALAACGASSSGDDPASAPTDPASAPTDRAAPDASFGTIPSAGDGEPAPGSADGTGSTTSLVPSAEADLPTAPPSAAGEGGPSTTLPAGPLPIPAVQLIDIGAFDAPVGVAVRPLDPRLFVVEQAGRVLAVDDESATPVLDVTERTEASGEQGLLGLAFHPERDLAYVNYIDQDGDTVIAEFAVDPVSAAFDPGSFRQVMTVAQPFPNHNGGALVFGPDGMLYIGLGDGGAAADPLRAGLDLGTRLGKLLRIDPLEFGDEPFVVPADNPFVGVDGADPTIWSLGLRNPWRVSFDAATGDLWIADVGQNEFEEVNRAAADGGRDAGRGLSFGWSAFEADAPFNDDQDPTGHTPPVIVYSHVDGNCSVSGGTVVRGSRVTNLDGWYVYGDYCSGTIWGYDTTSAAGAPVVVELGLLPALTSVARGPNGELFAVSSDGTVARFADA